MSEDVIRAKQGLALEMIAKASSFDSLREIEIAQVGKKGEITQLSKLIGTLPGQERRAFGQAVNAAKKAVLDAIESRRTSLVDDEIAA